MSKSHGKRILSSVYKRREQVERNRDGRDKHLDEMKRCGAAGGSASAGLRAEHVVDTLSAGIKLLADSFVSFVDMLKRQRFDLGRIGEPAARRDEGFRSLQ